MTLSKITTINHITYIIKLGLEVSLSDIGDLYLIDVLNIMIFGRVW
jgi:hypothetical protein